MVKDLLNLLVYVCPRFSYIIIHSFILRQYSGIRDNFNILTVGGNFMGHGGRSGSGMAVVLKLIPGLPGSTKNLPNPNLTFKKGLSYADRKKF